MEYKHPSLVGVTADKDGNVYSNGILLKGTVTQYGYRQYSFSRKSYLGHRIVVECYLGRNLSTSEEINHLNLNKLDNNVNNLEVTDRDGNSNHLWKNVPAMNYADTKVIRPWKAGENHHNAKLSREDVKEMIADIYNGAKNQELADKFGVHSRYVSLIRHKRRWKTVWNELNLEGSETIPSGSRVGSHKSLLETETIPRGL